MTVLKRWNGTEWEDVGAGPSSSGQPAAHASSHASAGSDAVTLAESQVTGLTSALAAKAPLASPTFTGTPAAPTAAQGTNTTQLASTAFVQTEAGLLIPKSLVDAKGDLIVGTAADTVDRLAAGTNGHVLTADSAEAAGVKWAAAAGGGSALTVQEEGTPLATAADTLNFVGANVTASGAAGTKTITVGGIDPNTLDANSVLYATTDDTPAALAMPASTALARLATGDVIAANMTQFRILLALAPGHISGFDTQVRTSRVDQMAIPTANLNINAKRLTSVASGLNLNDALAVGQTPAILRRTGSIAETFSRKGASTVNLAATASGTLLLMSIPLPFDAVISSVTFLSGTAAMVTPTNQMGVLYDASRNLVANSADLTTAAWAASTEKTFSFAVGDGGSGIYSIPTAGLYYIGFWVTAATAPSLYGTTNSAATIGGLAPITVGTSNTGLTNTPPNPANALTAIVRDPWAYVS